MIAPIDKTLSVAVPPDRAFHLFTVRISSWWPADAHSVAAQQGGLPQDIVLEPETGGQIYEVLANGARALWGEVTIWSPHSVLEMTWHPGKSAAQATRVRVEFVADGSGTTVTLTHSGWSALAEPDDLRRGYDTGWDYVLGKCYCDAADAEAQAQPPR
ncbi:MAG: SRPBCC domain-containing protein [Pseudomonadota bacterium]